MPIVPGTAEVPDRPPQYEIVHGMEATDILRLAQENPLRTADPNPIRTLARVALDPTEHMSVEDATPVVRNVGPWLDPSPASTTTDAAARFLRGITFEGVYPERLSSVDAWDLVASAFEMRKVRLSPGMARTFLYCAGVRAEEISEAAASQDISFNRQSITNLITLFAQDIYTDPEKAQGFVNTTIEKMRPLTLPEVDTELDRKEAQAASIVDSILIRADLGALIGNTTFLQNIIITKQLCLRYLDRPQMTSRHNPRVSIDRLWKFCNGQSVRKIREDEGASDTTIRAGLESMTHTLSATLTNEDRASIRKFVEGKTETVQLERFPANIPKRRRPRKWTFR